MLNTYTARYTKISSGYMGQIVEWPEVVTEGENFEQCRELLKDALREIILAYQQLEKEIPPRRVSFRTDTCRDLE
jgi:predicted RNase H-like HicB family nuclease